MVTKKPNPADFTGAQRERLAAQQGEAARNRDQELSMATARQAELVDEVVVDYSTPDAAPAPAAVGADGEVLVVDGEPLVATEPTKVIRVNTTLEDVTIGHGTNYTFIEGRQYRVSSLVAGRLEELGYVWH